MDYEEVVNEELLLNLSKEMGIMTAPIVQDNEEYFDYYQITKKYGI